MKKPLGWGQCLLAAGLVMLIALCLCHLTFETNDDSSIVAIASGGFTGSPYAGNGYTSYLYGALLAGLYTLWAALPWHALILLLLIFLSLAAVLKSLLALCQVHSLRPALGLGLFVALCAGVFFPYIAKLQYTAVAAFACGGGMALLLAHYAAPKGRDRTLSLLLAGALLLFSFCLRSDSFWPGAALILGFLVMDALESRSLRPLIPAAVAAVAALMLGALDTALYRLNEPGWDTFRQFYHYRCQLLDYHNTDLMAQVATTQLGWPQPTVDIIRNWYMLDPLINTDSLKALITAIQLQAPAPTAFSLIKATGSILRRYPMFAFNFAAFALLGLCSAIRFFKEKKGPRLLKVIGAGAFMIAFIAYFYGVLGRLPERAAFAAACPGYIALALACLPALQGKAALKPRPLAALLVGLTLLAGTATLALTMPRDLALRWQPTAQTSREKLSETLRDYAQAHPDAVCVTDIPQRYSPLYAGKTYAVSLVEWGHAMQGSDMLKAKLAACDLTALTTETLFAPNVRLIISHGNISLFTEYLQALYPTCQLSPQENGAGYGIYTLSLTN